MDVNEFLRDAWQTALVFLSMLVLVRILGKAQVPTALLRQPLSHLIQIKLGRLREKGILDISEVQYAFFEAKETLSIIQKSANKPVTQQDLNL